MAFFFLLRNLKSFSNSLNVSIQRYSKVSVKRDFTITHIINNDFFHDNFFSKYLVTYLLGISQIIKIFRHTKVGCVLQMPALKFSFFNQIFIQEHETLYNNRMKIKSDRLGDWNFYWTFLIH